MRSVQEELFKCLNGLKLPVEEYTKYANEAHVFPDTTPKVARPLDEVPPGQPQAQQQPQMVMNSGYPSLSERVLSQSMHSYQGSSVVSQAVPASYTSSLLGSHQMMPGQAMGAYNGQPAYNLSSSYSSMMSQARENGQYI